VTYSGQPPQPHQVARLSRSGGVVHARDQRWAIDGAARADDEHDRLRRQAEQDDGERNTRWTAWVCRPVISDPTAARSGRIRETSGADDGPMTQRGANRSAPGTAWCDGWPQQPGARDPQVGEVGRGGEDELLPPVRWMTSRWPDEGDGAALPPARQARVARLRSRRRRCGWSRASSPAIVLVAMPAHFLAESVRDPRRQLRDGRESIGGAGRPPPELRQEPAGAAAQHHDASRAGPLATLCVTNSTVRLRRR